MSNFNPDKPFVIELFYGQEEPDNFMRIPGKIVVTWGDGAFIQTFWADDGSTVENDMGRDSLYYASTKLVNKEPEAWVCVFNQDSSVQHKSATHALFAGGPYDHEYPSLEDLKKGTKLSEGCVGFYEKNSKRLVVRDMEMEG